MARVAPSDVKGGGFDTDLSVSAIQDRIDDAHIVVSEDATNAGYSAARLDAIEKYLARHLIRFSPDPQTEREDLGDTTLSYTGAFDKEGLKATSPGQMVLEYDIEDVITGRSQPSAGITVPDARNTD